MSTSVLKTCLVNLISKDTHLVFSLTWQTSRCQQALSKPCLVNLISKDTHLVFSITPIMLNILCITLLSKFPPVNLQHSRWNQGYSFNQSLQQCGSASDGFIRSHLADLDLQYFLQKINPCSAGRGLILL